MSVWKLPNSPHANMTTYFLSFVFSGENEQALVDRSEVPVPFSHEINIVTNTTSLSSLLSVNAEFELARHFPVFKRLLVYDPSLSLGALLGGRDELGISGDDNVGMIIAVAVVAVPVAVVIVLAVIVAGSVPRAEEEVRGGQVEEERH